MCPGLSLRDLLARTHLISTQIRFNIGSLSLSVESKRRREPILYKSYLKDRRDDNNGPLKELLDGPLDRNVFDVSILRDSLRST